MFIKKYEHKFVDVPIVTEKKGVVNVAHKGATFEACKDVIITEANNGWRLKNLYLTEKGCNRKQAVGLNRLTAFFLEFLLKQSHK